MCSSDLSSPIRARVMTSRIVLIAVRDHIAKETGLVAAEGLSAIVRYVELLDIADFEINGWRVEVRSILSAREGRLVIPTMPLMVGVQADFYIAVEIGRSLEQAKLLGFIRQSDLANAELSANGLFALIPLSDLLPIKWLPAMLVSRPELDQFAVEFAEAWQERVENTLQQVESAFAHGMKSSSWQSQSTIERIRDEVWRAFEGRRPDGGLRVLLERLLARFGLMNPVPALIGDSLTYRNSFDEEQMIARGNLEHELVADTLDVRTRVPLYRHLLGGGEGLELIQSLRRVLDVMTGGRDRKSTRLNSSH